MSWAALICLETSCPAYTVHRKTALGCLRILGQRKPLACIGGNPFFFPDVFQTLTNVNHRTWILTAENILDPRRRLAEERKKLDIEDDAFVTCDIGETLFF